MKKENEGRITRSGDVRSSDITIKIDFLKFSHRRLMSMQTAQNLWDPRPDKQYSTERALFIGKNDWM